MVHYNRCPVHYTKLLPSHIGAESSCGILYRGKKVKDDASVLEERWVDLEEGEVGNWIEGGQGDHSSRCKNKTARAADVSLSSFWCLVDWWYRGNRKERERENDVRESVIFKRTRSGSERHVKNKSDHSCSFFLSSLGISFLIKKTIMRRDSRWKQCVHLILLVSRLTRRSREHKKDMQMRKGDERYCVFRLETVYIRVSIHTHQCILHREFEAWKR